MATRQERNQRAYDLGFRGKTGGKAGALDAQIEYHKSQDFKTHLASIEKQNAKNNWDLSTQDMRKSIDFTHFHDHGKSRALFSRDIALALRNNPKSDLMNLDKLFGKAEKYFDKKHFEKGKYKKLKTVQVYIAALGLNVEEYQFYYHHRK